ncbi:hypothetical protein [Streptomyces sp. NPDC088141]
MWHKLLGLRADRQDDFFSIGGHSLLALRGRRRDARPRPARPS